MCLRHQASFWPPQTHWPAQLRWKFGPQPPNANAGVTADETAAYVAHRLTIAGGGSVVSFTAKALQSVYNYSAGIPRVINLVCDRALLAAYSDRAMRVTPDMVRKGAASLDLAPPRASMFAWLRHQAARLF